jgi:hypothetical protein
MKNKVAVSVCILLLMLTAVSSCIQAGNSSTRAELAVLKKELKTDAAGKVTLAVTVKNTGPVKAELAGVKNEAAWERSPSLDTERQQLDEQRRWLEQH